MTTQNREAAVAALLEVLTEPDHDAQCRTMGSDAEAECIAIGLSERGYAIVPAAQDSDALLRAASTLLKQSSHREQPWVEPVPDEAKGDLHPTCAVCSVKNGTLVTEATHARWALAERIDAALGEPQP